MESSLAVSLRVAVKAYKRTKVEVRPCAHGGGTGNGLGKLIYRMARCSSAQVEVWPRTLGEAPVTDSGYRTARLTVISAPGTCRRQWSAL